MNNEQHQYESSKLDHHQTPNHRLIISTSPTAVSITNREIEVCLNSNRLGYITVISTIWQHFELNHAS